MKALMIGGCGFVGRYLTRHLKQHGYETVATKMPDRRASDEADTVCELDILEEGAVERLLEKTNPDILFHLAAQSSVAASWNDPGQTIDVNIRGSTNVLEAVRRQRKKIRVVLVGSSEEYGKIMPEKMPVSEQQRMQPANIYAATKACQNMIGNIYAQAYGLDIVMVRAFNHIGPGQSADFVVSGLCRQAARIKAGLQEAVIKAGNLDVRRDFTDVRDIVRAYAMLAEKGQSGETYNVGSGHAVSIAEVLQIIITQAAVPIRIEIDPERFRPLDVPVVEADIRKLESITGWKPEISLAQTVREMLQSC
ncbi:MAG: GDP-mannose 4,6-dehydratase [Eubacterium sp.]|nr:GDP-mannose 4,6-dehydratase [Eubacterium sp.]